MNNTLINSNVHTNTTDNIIKYKEFTIIESYSNDITTEEFLKQIITYHIKN